MVARRRVLGRLAIIMFGIAVLAASPGRGLAAGAADASAPTGNPGPTTTLSTVKCLWR